MMDMWNDKSSFILWWELKVVPLSKGVVKPPNYTTPWGRNKGLLGIKLPGSLPGPKTAKQAGNSLSALREQEVGVEEHKSQDSLGVRAGETGTGQNSWRRIREVIPFLTKRSHFMRFLRNAELCFLFT